MRTTTYVLTAAISVAAVWLAFGLLASCHAPLPEPDIVITETGVRTTCMTAAENMHAIHCPEADDAGAFAQVCQHVVETRLEPIDVRCMTLAPSKEVARTCPNVRCP